MSVSLNGLGNPPACVTPYRTSAGENHAQRSPVGVSSGAFTIKVSAKSVVTAAG